MVKNKSVLITGGSGLLATNWAQQVKDDFNVILALHQRQISLSGVQTITIDTDNLANLPDGIDIIINTIGLTSVEKCEQNPQLAQQNNVETAANLAKFAQKNNIKFVHISTDHLFDGAQSYDTENTPPTPLNIYAKTKLAAEQQVVSIDPNALIVRTNFFGNGTQYRQSFSDVITTSLKNNQTIELFDDVFYTPILVAELAKITHQLIDKDTQGIINIVSDERLSKYEFGLKIADIFNLDKSLIKAISINDKPNLVGRPKDMSLSNEKLKTIIGEITNIDTQIKQLLLETNRASLNLIPYGRHYLDDNDIQAVVSVLKHGALTQGNQIIKFERRIADYVGVKYAVAVSSGTAALHLAALAINLKPGDCAITSPNTFVATSNAILYVGAKPIFIDIDEKTLNIDIHLLEKTIIHTPNIKAIFPVHFAGLPCEMDEIVRVAKKYQLAIIEDAAHALGATYQDGSMVGNCYYSDMTTFSFHPVKGIAAGEGGMVTTNDEQIYRKLLMLRSHGITKGNFEFPGVSVADGGIVNAGEALEDGQLKRWYYEMQQLGFNYRITDIQCALACSQMDKIDVFLSRRQQLVKQYDEALINHPHIKPQQTHARSQSSHHIYIIRIDFEKLNTSRNQFMAKLANKGVGSQVHYIPVPMQPYYQNLGYNTENHPMCQTYYKNTLSIPLYYGLSDDDQRYIIKTLTHLAQ